MGPSDQTKGRRSPVPGWPLQERRAPLCAWLTGKACAPGPRGRREGAAPLSGVCQSQAQLARHCHRDQQPRWCRKLSPPTPTASSGKALDSGSGKAEQSQRPHLASPALQGPVLHYWPGNGAGASRLLHPLCVSQLQKANVMCPLKSMVLGED